MVHGAGRYCRSARAVIVCYARRGRGPRPEGDGRALVPRPYSRARSSRRAFANINATSQRRVCSIKPDVKWCRYGAAHPVRKDKRRREPSLLESWFRYAAHLDVAIPVQPRPTGVGGPARRAFFERLAERVNLVRYDSRGIGMSERGALDYSVKAHFRDLEAVAARADLERFGLYAFLHMGPPRSHTR